MDREDVLLRLLSEISTSLNSIAETLASIKEYGIKTDAMTWDEPR